MIILSNVRKLWVLKLYTNTLYNWDFKYWTNMVRKVIEHIWMREVDERELNVIIIWRINCLSNVIVSESQSFYFSLILNYIIIVMGYLFCQKLDIVSNYWTLHVRLIALATWQGFLKIDVPRDWKWNRTLTTYMVTKNSGKCVWHTSSILSSYRFVLCF